MSKTKTTVNELENINSCISCGKLLKKTSSNCVCEVANVERTDKYGKIIIDIDCDVGSSMTTRTQKKVKRKSIDSSLDTPVYVAKEIETEIKETKHGKKKKDVIIIDEVDSENDIGVNKLKDCLPVLVDSDQADSTKVVSVCFLFLFLINYNYFIINILFILHIFRMPLNKQIHWLPSGNQLNILYKILGCHQLKYWVGGGGGGGGHF